MIEPQTLSLQSMFPLSGRGNVDFPGRIYFDLFDYFLKNLMPKCPGLAELPSRLGGDLADSRQMRYIIYPLNVWSCCGPIFDLLLKKMKNYFLRPGLPSASSLSSVGPGEGEAFPILTDYPWFHGTLSRSEAAAMVTIES